MRDATMQVADAARVQASPAREELSRRRFLAIAGSVGAAAGVMAIGADADTAEAAVCGDGCLNVKDFGAVGNGSTDDSSAFQDALNDAAEAGGGIVAVPGGTYRVDSSLTYEGANLLLDLAPNAVIDFSNAAEAATLLSINGSKGVPVSLSADASAGTTSVAIAPGAEKAFSIGDWIFLSSDKLLGPEGDPPTIGEWNKVKSLASGSITLRWVLQDTYLTADDAAIAPATMAHGPLISGGHFVGGAEKFQSAIRCRYCVGTRIIGTNFKHFDQMCIGLSDCIAPLVSSIIAIGGNQETLNDFYGVAILGGTQDAMIEDSYFEDFRHAITHGHGGAVSGVPRRTTILNCHSVGALEVAYDSHLGAEEVKLIGSTAHGCDGLAGFRGPSALIDSCTGSNLASVGIVLYNHTYKPWNYDVINTTINGCESNAIAVIDGLSHGVSGVGAAQGHVRIADFTSIDAGGSGIVVASAESWRFKGITITGADLINPCRLTGIGQAVLVKKADSVDVSNVHIVDLPEEANGLRFQDVTAVQSTGNVVEYVGQSGNKIPFRNVAVRGGRIAENTLIGATTSSGVYLDGQCEDLLVEANMVMGAAFPVNPSSGEGHIIRRVLPTVQSNATNADFTLTVNDAMHTMHTGTLSADRTVTLSTSQAYRGDRIMLTRTGGGAFTLNVGPGPLISLKQKEWCEIVFDGSAWAVASAGSLP